MVEAVSVLTVVLLVVEVVNDEAAGLVELPADGTAALDKTAALEETKLENEAELGVAVLIAAVNKVIATACDDSEDEEVEAASVRIRSRVCLPFNHSNVVAATCWRLYLCSNSAPLLDR